MNGNITFTPEPGFSGSPKKVRYTADDVLGALLDDEGEIMVGYAQADCPVEVPKPAPTETVTVLAQPQPAATVTVTERVPDKASKDSNPSVRATELPRTGHSGIIGLVGLAAAICTITAVAMN